MGDRSRSLLPRIAALSIGVLALAGPARSQVPGPGVGGPLPGLTPAQLAAFADGRAAFVQRFSPPEGLGPMFNDDSCVACHNAPVAGGGSGRLVTRFGRAKGRTFDPLEALGGSLVQARALPLPPCNLVPELVPAEANVQTGRRTQPIFGLGLVDAVLDETFEELARLEAESSRRTAGRVHRVIEVATGESRVGRFGWKAQVATLRDFSGDALLNEVGLTNPLFPDESCPQGDCALLSCNPRPDLNDGGALVARMTVFQQFLAPPPRGPITPAVAAGEAVFEAIGCGGCHVSTLVTGPHPVAALNEVEIHPYSDFLLHDMGRLGDGIVQGDAAGSEFRTAPLWGVSLQPRLLHDGRAATLEEAIDGHEGQGAAARRAFGRLSDADRASLVAFLRSL